MEERLEAFLWGYPELSLLFFEMVKIEFDKHRKLLQLRVSDREYRTAAFNRAWEVLKVRY